MQSSRLPGVPFSGATASPRVQIEDPRKAYATGQASSTGASRRNAPADIVANSGALPPALGTTTPPRRLELSAASIAQIPPTSPAAKVALASAVDATLERTRAHLVSLQGVDGSWNTPFNGGVMMMALGSLAKTRVGTDPRAKELVALFGQEQDSQNGSFALNFSHGATGHDVPSSAATELVATALEQIAATQPDLAADALAISKRARAYLARHPASNDNLYDMTANVVSDLISGTNNVTRPSIGLVTALVSGLAHGTLSGLASVFAAPIMLLFIEQARRGGGFDIITSLITRVFSTDALVQRIVDGQDADGSWGWTEFGIALAVMALQAHGSTRTDELNATRSDAIDRGIGFIDELRKSDLRNWTRGDAWDTGIVAMTIQALNAKADDPVAAKAAKAAKAVLAGQLEDGRFSFSIHGKLGDNDTSSTILRSLCERYAVTTDNAERQELATAITNAARGLAAYQQEAGSWGAFTQVVDRGQNPYRAPATSSDSALYDVGSPDLTARVTRSLLAARDSGVLPADVAAKVDSALARAKEFLVKVQDPANGTWWSRWIAGRVASFAFVVPALRRLGLAPNEATFAQTRSFLLAHQNKDGGWDEGIEADRSSDRIGKGIGISTPVQTASAIIALIGTCKDSDASDPALNKALQAAVSCLLDVEKNGAFTNGRQLYTILYGADYYDADASTTCFVAAALRLYRDFVAMGPEKALASSPL